jgi:pantoate--beta-alanine ligase
MSELRVITTATEMSELVSVWKAEGHTVALVPTMGFLHEGHGALVDKAATLATRVVVSIFVNPLQFGKGEDFDSYPRNEDADREFLSLRPVDVVFIPGVSEVYPEGDAVTCDAGALGDTYEGAARVGHFDGVLTVVKRLCEIVAADYAVFGRKDAQQLFLVEAMVQSTGLGLSIVPVDTVRAADGLALSSRNSYLSADQRALALAIPRALDEAEAQPSLSQALALVSDRLGAVPGLAVDYVDAVDPAAFGSVASDPTATDAVLILAVRLGNTRLIDNRRLHFPQ